MARSRLFVDLFSERTTPGVRDLPPIKVIREYPETVAPMISEALLIVSFSPLPSHHPSPIVILDDTFFSIFNAGGKRSENVDAQLQIGFPRMVLGQLGKDSLGDIRGRKSFSIKEMRLDLGGLTPQPTNSSADPLGPLPPNQGGSHN